MQAAVFGKVRAGGPEPTIETSGVADLDLGPLAQHQAGLIFFVKQQSLTPALWALSALPSS